MQRMKAFEMITLKNRAAWVFLAVLIALSFFSDARALTPANTVVAISNIQLTAEGGSINLSKPAVTPSITIMPVSGIAWQATATNTAIAAGQSVTYQYRFAHNGNIGIAPAKDNFYITVTGAWVQQLCQDAACTLTATNTVALPPNAGNTYTFYVKVAAPAGSNVGQSSTTTVQIDNEYYHAHNANDAFGDPDRITSSVITNVPDTVSPALAITSPANQWQCNTITVNLTGQAETGDTGYIGISPSGATQTLSVAGDGSFAHTLPLSQGQNIISVTTQDAAGNISIATRTVFMDSYPPVADISSPADFAQVSGAVSITGSATDTHFMEYSLRYGPGQNPTAWGIITATSTLPVTGASLGTWNAANLYGEYVVLLTAVDTYGNVTETRRKYSIGSSNKIAATIPAGQWTMVSIPGIPYNPDPTAWLGTGRYEIQRWDPTMASPDPYVAQYKRSFAVTAGAGFWVKSYGIPIDFNIDAWVATTTQQYVIPINSGWNQIGDPYTRDMLWDYFNIRNASTGETRTLNQAVAANWIDSTFYSYDGNNYSPHTIGENLSSGKGYFFKSYVDGELQIDPGAGRPNGVARVIRPRYEWKLQLAAKTPDLSDTNNFAGILKSSNDTLDPEDSGEPPLVEQFLTLYFPHEDWAGKTAGRYSRDVRPEPISTNPSVAPEKVWTFAVKSSEPDTPVTVSWPNAKDLPTSYSYEITDETTGTKIDPSRTSEYQYVSHDSTPRTFELAARKLGALAEIELPFSLTPGWNLIAVPLEPEQTDAVAQLGSQLPNPNIYQYYDRTLNGANSRQRVDIQAGIGYWLYSDTPRQVHFKGMPTATSKPVDVPLTPGWNLIGDPYDSPIPFGDNIKVTRGNETAPLSEAVNKGWLDGRLFRFDANTDGYETLGQGASMQPLQGYIIKANSDCTLKFETQ